MINIDTRLFSQVDSNELWLLCHIVKRLNEKMFCFPSNKTLLKDTGWAMQKLQLVKKSLIEKGLLEVQSRYFGETQASNFYHLRTRHIGVYVDGERLSKQPHDNPTPHKRKSSTPVVKVKQGPVGEKQATNEVLSINEVLPVDSRESTGKTNTPFGEERSVQAKEKKAAHPAFKGCVDHWLKVLHPGWGFSGADGKAVNQIIGKIEKRLAARQVEVAAHNWTVVYSFMHFCKSLPEFYKSQTLTVLNAKFDSIMDQIRNGTKGDNYNSKPSASRIIEAL